MFKRKQDLDKHVQSILKRKKDEKERYAQGYQIARLYKEINEYETARRYLAGFLQVRDNNAQAHQLMGEINEGLGKIEPAIESYKRALDLGGFSSSNRQLVLRICELFCEQGTDTQRMKYWLGKCESLYPRSDVIYKMKAQLALASSSGSGDNTEMEKILIDEMMNRPSDVDLRIKLLNLYTESERIEEAYNTATNIDLTTAFTNNLQWYQCLQNIFKLYRDKNDPEPSFLLLHLHVLRNWIYLSLSGKVTACVEALKRFDAELKVADELAHQDEAWLALCGEMRAQFFYLAGLVIMKRATMGSLSWQEANQMSGTCFLASQKVSPLDAQASWFVKSPDGYLKLYQWWHLQSYDRFSQIGHMIRQLAKNDVTDWSRSVCRQMMNTMGQKRVFETLYGNSVTQSFSDLSFFYGSHLIMGKLQEPLSLRQLLDVDRVAYQVHLRNLPQLVWLCLQRYSLEMKSQPNYVFTLMENMRYSVKILDSGSCESLCQLDILTFLLATVRCAASSLAESNFLHQDDSDRPTLLPACLSRPMCSTEQEEWWMTMYQFCTNSVKDDFSRMRRLLMRGIEAVRLVGSHGVSVTMQCHLARCLDAKVVSLRKGELGSRCSAAELSALEDRAVFYWVKAKAALERLQKNKQQPLVKNCMFKELDDTDLTPKQTLEYLSEARFAIAKCSYLRGNYEEALHGFCDHASPWASYHCGEIYMNHAERCGDSRQDEVYRALIRKARDCFYQTLDRLNGDKTHELNVLVSRSIDDLEVEIQSFDWGDDSVDGARNSTRCASTPMPADISAIGRNGASGESLCSTPRPLASYSSPAVLGNSSVSRLRFENTPETGSSTPLNSSSSTCNTQFRPSPERLESQIKSLGYSQTTLFKMVLDRNEELVLMHSRMMEEHRNNNNELKTVLTENKTMMEELKMVLAENKHQMERQKDDSKGVMEGLKRENKEMMGELKTLMIETRDMLKLMKNDLAMLKPGFMAAQAMPPGPPLIMGAHLPGVGVAPRGGPFPGFPQPQPGVMPQYPGYVLNSAMPPAPPGQMTPAPGGYRAIPGARMPSLGKYKTGDEEDDQEDDLDNSEDLAAVYSEYYDPDQSYSQYYTPDSHIQDWSLRAQMDNSMPMPSAVQPPRMAMPQPGFFASALRGQSLQYAQAGLPSPTSLPGMVRPSFFSTPSTPVVPPPGPVPSAVNVGSSVGTGSTNVSGSGVANVASTSTPSTSGFEILLIVKAFLPVRSASGAITILSTPINKSSVVMMSDTKEMLFHHDISGLQLLPPPSPNTAVVSWSAMKIGSADKEIVSVRVDSETDRESLKQMLIKHACNSVRPSQPSQASSAAAGAGIISNVSPAVSTTAGSGQTNDAGKNVYGKFTFSEAPKLSPIETQHDREKAIPHKITLSPTKEDVSKPFAGFAFKLPGAPSPSTQPSRPQPQYSPVSSCSDGPKTPHAASFVKSPTKTAQPSPAAGGRSAGRGEDDRADEYEPNIDFKPVINLPDLVEKKTGEEEETAMYVERCRMFRYDQTTSQWKERGVGELKILSNNKEVRFRIVMRREQILKLCANHFISEDMKLTPLASSDRSWCYSAMDFSEEEMKSENLAVKFKNAAKAKNFKEAFTDCQALLKTHKKVAPVKPVATTPAASPKAAAALSSPATASSLSSWADAFKPKAGSWECTGCLIRNDAGVLKCPACMTPKPGTVAPIATPAPSLSAPASSAWGDKFKPKLGSWECNGCLVRNDSDVLKCPACETLKPGVSKEDLPKTEASSSTMSITPGTPGTGGFKLGGGGGFSFGNIAAPDSSKSPFSGFGSPSFGAAAAPSIFGNKSAETPTQAAGFSMKPSSGFSFGASQPGSSAGGFSFGSAGGFAFGSASTTAAPNAIPATSAIPAGGFAFGSASTTTAPDATPATSATPAGPSVGAGGITSTSATEKPGDSLLASLLTSDDPDGTEKKGSGFNFLMTPSKVPQPAGGQPLFGQSASTPTTNTGTTPDGPSKFNFTFNNTPPATHPQTPVKSPPVSAGPPKAVVPGSPEVDEHGMYVTKDGDDTHIHFEPVVRLPQNVELKTGEEDEDILFEARGKMYRFGDGEWKERGLGVVKILEHQENKTARVLMRRDRILKLCCNHRIDPSLSLQPMVNTEGKAWVWYALDFSEEEPKMEQLALRFRNAEIATEFKDVFDRCKVSAPSMNSPTTTAPPGGHTKQSEGKTEEEDDDVIFVKEEFPTRGQDVKVKPEEKGCGEDVVLVKEEVATKDQIAMAKTYRLPAHFYLYANKPRCPGCLGCTDGEGLPSWATKPSTPVKAPPSSSSASAKPTLKAKQENVFGQKSASSGLPDFTKLSQSGPGTSSSQSEPPIFGSSTGLDFSSLAGTPATNGFAFQKSDTSGPFKFAGAGQALFGARSPPDGAGGAEGDEDAVQASNDIHFEPVIALPDLVEVKTGEEDWFNMFVHRAKLYKFHKDSSQWKECGVGEIKMMRHNEKTQFRILMRRDQILKLACNHFITTDMNLKPMSSSETAWCWVACDFSDIDGDSSVEKFAIKFNKKSVAQDFKTIFEDCQMKLKEASEAVVTSTTEDDDPSAKSKGHSVQEDQTYEDEEDDEDDDEEEGIIFEKRVTLQCWEKNDWKKLGLGQLIVKFNDDVQGNAVEFRSDDDDIVLCSHIVCREHRISLNSKAHSCEWNPIDYSIDEPIRRRFSAVFSSNPAAEEFARVFMESQSLAMDSEISETISTEIDIPEVFSGGESRR